MLTFYKGCGDGLEVVAAQEAAFNPAQLVWIDLLEPTAEEEQAVERMLATDIPTREEMHEIEISSRLYEKNDALYATATIVAKTDTVEPETHATTFVLVKNTLVTVRYVDSKPFKTFLIRIKQHVLPNYQGNTLFAALLDAIVDRLADVLEMVGHNIDNMGKRIFRPGISNSHNPKEKPDFEELLMQIGAGGDLISKTRESMVSIMRLLSFISQTAYFKPGSDEHNRTQLILRDLPGLGDHANFLSGKINFLLDTTLGMISIEQNAIIKIFSVAAVIFLPPTLIASIYGMNFHSIPELDWTFGYPFAIGLMVLSGYLPYKFFKRKGWL